MGSWIQAGDFAMVMGEPEPAMVVGDAWDVYAGVRTDNTLARVVSTDKVHGRRFFVNDNYWWQYTDAQCTFHAIFGWRPFFDPSYREIDFNTWNRFFECQADAAIVAHFKAQSELRKSPPVGFFPHSVYPEKEAGEQLTFFYSNSFDPGDESHERHDEQIDYQLMNVITATDWVLFERDLGVARRLLEQVELFMQALEQRMDPDGLLPVGPQGSQIEFGHGGWRYPSSTFVYLVRACRNMAEVAGMVEEGTLDQGSRRAQASKCRERWEERGEKLVRHLGMFLQGGRWFASALDRTRSKRLGTGLVDSSPSSYFESFPNLNSIVLGVAGPHLAQSILDRMDEIPQLTRNTLVLISFPERPVSEMDDDHEGFPRPGDHANGGAWWMPSSSMAYAFTALGHPRAYEYVRDLLRMHDAHLSIDVYYNWGEDPASQFADKANGAQDHYSVTASGPFGMLFRGFLGVTPRKDGIGLSPRLPAGITRMKTLAPVYYGGKQVFFEILDSGRPYPEVQANTPGVFVPDASLSERSTVVVSGDSCDVRCT